MQVSLCVLREVEVDNHVYRLDVNSSGEQIYWKATEDYSSATTYPGLTLRFL